MSDEGARELVGGFGAGILQSEERARLFRAALDDQELFDDLVTEDALVELLEDPEARALLQRELSLAPTLPIAAVAALPLPDTDVTSKLPDTDVSTPLRRRSRLPLFAAFGAGGGALLAAAAALLFVLWRPPTVVAPGPGPATPPTTLDTGKGFDPLSVPTESPWAWVWTARASAVIPGALEVVTDTGTAPAHLASSDAIRVRLSSDRESVALLFELRDGTTTRLFPVAGARDAAKLPKGEVVSLPDASEPAASVGAPGPVRLRLLLLPADVDVRDGAAVRRAVDGGRASVIEQAYVVDAPRR